MASNYFWINVYIKISPNQKYIISTVSQGSHISGLTKFHDISMLFIIFLQNSMIFPGFPGVLYFSRFSSKCGNPVQDYCRKKSHYLHKKNAESSWFSKNKYHYHQTSKSYCLTGSGVPPAALPVWGRGEWGRRKGGVPLSCTGVPPPLSQERTWGQGQRTSNQEYPPPPLCGQTRL